MNQNQERKEEIMRATKEMMPVYNDEATQAGWLAGWVYSLRVASAVFD